MSKTGSIRATPISTIDIKEVFNYYDRNQDGILETKELGVALRSYGLCPSQSELKQLESELGTRINFDMFKNAAKRFNGKSKNSEEETREALRIFDREGTGKVDMFEIKHSMTTMGEQLRDEEVDELIREVDTDADGKAYLEDVVRILSSHR